MPSTGLERSCDPTGPEVHGVPRRQAAQLGYFCRNQSTIQHNSNSNHVATRNVRRPKMVEQSYQQCVLHESRDACAKKWLDSHTVLYHDEPPGMNLMERCRLVLGLQRMGRSHKSSTGVYLTLKTRQ